MTGAPRGARLLLLAAAALVFGALGARLAARTETQRFVPPFVAPAPAAPAGAPLYETRKVSSGATPFAHAAAAIELADGGLRAFWFAGSREGATDAAIYSARYAAPGGRWEDERVVATPRDLGHGLARWVRKVGNPAVARGADGRLRLFVVSVTAGGWAGSAINLLESADEGASWGAPRRLVASPFLNLSTLVKAAPLAAPERGVWLPAYHEFAAKFGELLRVDAAGTVRGKVRLAADRAALQPVVVPRGEREALALLRDAGPAPGRVLAARSTDGGASWSAVEKTALPNPNSGLDALRLADGAVLLAFNNTDADRYDLSLVISRDEGRSWRAIHRLEYDASRAAEFSYPKLLADRAGDFHVLYTVNKAEIRHVRFNRAWLEEHAR